MPKNDSGAIWTSYANFFLGLWLISGAFTFGYKDQTLILNDLICGLLLTALTWALHTKKNWWLPWMLSLLGVWLQIAPLLFWANAAAYLNDTLVGALVIIFSIIIPPLPGQYPNTGPSVPPGWSYNPSSWGQRLPIALFAILGWFLSRYLAAFQLGHIDSIWDPLFGEGTINVLTSQVSRTFPVSDAGLGAFAYALEALLTCQGGEQRWRTSPWMVCFFGILVIPVGLVSICLIILQPLVVGSWCFLCLITALCSLLPISLACDEVAAVIQYLRYSKEKPFWKLFFQGGLCPEAIVDQRSPAPDASLGVLFRSSLWGVTIPINLLLSAFLGIALMFLPRIFETYTHIQDFDDVLGPLIVVISFVSLSELTRQARFLNFFFALGVFYSVFFYRTSLSSASFYSHLFLVILLCICTFRRGPIKEVTKFSYESGFKKIDKEHRN